MQTARPKLHGTVLLVEDNPESQKLLALILGKMGVSVITADDGEEAVRKASAGGFDLIYMDMQMPLMSGLDATKILRKQGYTGAIIALTAYATCEDRKACLQAGCDDYLSKPVNRDHLYAMTERYLATEMKKTAEQPIVSQYANVNLELQNLLLQFVKGLPHKLERLEQSIKQMDWDRFARLIHDLKGAGGTFGYPALSALAQRIEMELKQDNLQTVVSLFAELGRQCDRIYHGAFTQADSEPLKSVK